MIGLSWPDYQDLRERQTVFEPLVAWDRIEIGYAARGTSRSGIGERVTGDYFDALGVGPHRLAAASPSRHRSAGSIPDGGRDNPRAAR